MFEMLLKSMNIDPETFKRNFTEAFARVEKVEKEITDCRIDFQMANIKLDLILNVLGFDVNQINRDIKNIREGKPLEDRKMVIPVTNSDVGHA